MLRLSVPEGTRLAHMNSLDVHMAGTESNVLAGLACLDYRCGWFGGVPDHAIADFVQRQLQMAGIDSRAVSVPNSRFGTYYVEFATQPRAIQVIYDRANSAVTHLTPADIDFESLLDTRMIHLTGITPALGPNCMAVVEAILIEANHAGVPVSFDVNFRSKLWSAAEAGRALLPLLKRATLVLCGARDAANLFDCDGTPEEIVNRLGEKTESEQLVVTLGGEGVIGWDGAAWHRQPARPVEIIDRVGAGDALAAGVLHGYLQSDFDLGLRTGTMLAALVLSQHGDMLITTKNEVEMLLAQDGRQDIVR